MTTPGPSSAASQAAPMRCVICHPATAELPGELLTSLSKRMGRMTICTDVYAALAECCLIERDRRMISPGSPRAGGVLVLVHPRHMPHGDAARLVEAIRGHAPSIALWCYDRSANPKLRAVVEEDVARSFAPPFSMPSSTGSPPAQTPPAAVPSIHTRAVGDFAPKLVNGSAHPSNEHRSQSAARPQRAASLLTEEELRMLLSGDPAHDGPIPFRTPDRGAAPSRRPDNGETP